MFNILSGLLTLTAYIPYITAIVRRQTHPSRVSWWIWSAVGFLLMATYYDLGARAALGLAAGALIGQIVIAGLSLKYGAGGASSLDRLCLAGACGAGLLWWFTSSAFLPHLLIVLMDFFAWLATFRKVVKDPSSENLPAWIIWMIAAMFPLLDSAHWTFIDLLYPVYIVVSDGIVAGVILRARR